MKKITLLVLGLLIITTGSLFAGNIQAVDNEIWLDHTAKMQVLRENILTLVSKELPTATDKAELASLMKLFSTEKSQWAKYLEKVAKTPKASVKAYNGFRSRKGIGCAKGCKCQNCRRSSKIGQCPNCDGSCKKASACKTGRKYAKRRCHTKLANKCTKRDGSCKKASTCKTGRKCAKRRCHSKLTDKCTKLDGSCKKVSACKTSRKYKKYSCKSECK